MQRIASAVHSAITRVRPWEADVVLSKARLGVLLNARAKRVGKRVIQRFAARIDAPDLFVTHDLQEAERAVDALLNGGYDGIWLGGGDGTITHALNLMAERGRAEAFHRPLPPIGVLALGTGNGLAHLLGAHDPEEDLRYGLFEEPRASVELPLVDCDGFAVPFGSIGYDARVLNDYASMTASSDARWARSLAGYVAAVATKTIPAELGRPPAHYRVCAVGRSSAIDRETSEEVPLPPDAVLYEGPARAVLFGTSPYYGYGLKALPQARKRKDRFQIRISTAPVLHLLSNLPSIWRGTTRTPHFHDFLVEQVRITCDRPEPAQLAGEALGERDAMTLRLGPERFPLIAPGRLRP